MIIILNNPMILTLSNLDFDCFTSFTPFASVSSLNNDTPTPLIEVATEDLLEGVRARDGVRARLAVAGALLLVGDVKLINILFKVLIISLLVDDNIEALRPGVENPVVLVGTVEEGSILSVCPKKGVDKLCTLPSPRIGAGD
jgi:hypothetical protein